MAVSDSDSNRVIIRPDRPISFGAVRKNSDRVACIRYIRENGEDAFAEKMAKEKQMTMKRNR